MKNLIDNFEKQFGKSVRNLTESDLEKCISDKKYAVYFSEDNVFLFIDGLIKLNSNSNFIKTLVALKYSLSLEINERIISALFSKYRNNIINRDELIKQMNEIKQKDFISVISVDLCSMIALSNLDISSDESLLKTSIEDIKDKIFLMIGSDIEKTHKLRCDLLDLIYQTRENFFSKYQTDILQDITWVDEETSKLTEWDDAKEKESTFPSAKISPEELGLIDITKLKSDKKE